jgi:hypothetical protein
MLVHNVLHGQIVTLLVAASFPTNSKCHHFVSINKNKNKNETRFDVAERTAPS